jgi:hypothetical protein
MGLAPVALKRNYVARSLGAVEEPVMNHLRLLATLLLGFALSVPLVDGRAHADVAGLNVVAPAKDFPNAWRSYPSMDAKFSRTGVPRSIAQVQRIAVGSTKNQLVNAVGQPVSAYQDGSWNFNVALTLPKLNRLICQYRVYFDDQGRVSGTAWRRPQCADIIIGQGN